MSLTAFQRYRRMQQVEEMKPENIEPQEEVIEEQLNENIETEENIEPQEEEEVVIEEPKPTRGRGRRA